MSDVANVLPRQKAKKRIVIFVFDGVQTLDLAGPLDVFCQMNRRFPHSYEICIAATTDQITMSSGIVVNTVKLEQLDMASIDLFIVPGGDATALAGVFQNRPLTDCIVRASRNSGSMASICTGALILAQLGLLKGRRATTHWAALDYLSHIDPSIMVEREAMYVEDRNVWTSAGITSGIDLSLALLRRDFGADAALSVARDLVVPAIRVGGQSIYSVPMQGLAGLPPDSDIDNVFSFLSENMHRSLDVTALANAVGLAPRTFHRRCLARFGMTPAHMLLEVRLENARSMLLNLSLPIKAIAAKTGYKSFAAFSKAFTRRYGLTPSAFRQGFAAKPDRDNVASQP